MKFYIDVDDRLEEHIESSLLFFFKSFCATIIACFSHLKHWRSHVLSVFEFVYNRHYRTIKFNCYAHLWTQRRLFVEVSFDKVAMLAGGDDTLSMDAYTAGVRNHLARHVLRRVARASRRWAPIYHRLAADRPFCYVVRPFVRRYRSRGFAKSGNQFQNYNLYKRVKYSTTFTSNGD